MLDTTWRLGLFGLVSCTMFLVGMWGCEYPFSTRTPQDPEKPRPYTLQSPTTPETAMNNFRIVYEYALSPVDHMDGLSQDFHFSPDPVDSLKYLETFMEPWGRDREEQFTANLFDRIVSDPNPRALSRFNEIVADVGGEAEAYFEYEYRLGFKDRKDESLKTAEGKARLYLRKGEDGNWALYRWVDEISDGAIDTWGALRAQY
ncbi:MAG: hypothetical protein V1800_09440 [Candidatus Latescibacterota bacterium]